MTCSHLNAAEQQSVRDGIFAQVYKHNRGQLHTAKQSWQQVMIMPVGEKLFAVELPFGMQS